MSHYSRYNNSEQIRKNTFLVKLYIEAYRRGDDRPLPRIREILLDYSKKALFKYLAVLKPYGYRYNEILLLLEHYISEFVPEIEYPVENIFSYFTGYINHRLYRIIEGESKTKRLSNYGCEYLEEGCYYNEFASRKPYHLQSDEDIPSWFSGSEILSEFIQNTKSKVLTNHEKEIINLKMLGHTYSEITNMVGLSYKQTIYIFNKGIDKLKLYFNMHSKSLQNLTIF